MDYVNLQVAIGGDANNTVPKFFVPVSEIPVLMAIHGPDALTDFEVVDAPEDAEELSDAEEIARLTGIYGRVQDTEGHSVIRQVYPGAGAKVVSSIGQLDIPEGAMKATERATARKAARKPTAAETKAAKAEAEAQAGAGNGVMD